MIGFTFRRLAVAFGSIALAAAAPGPESRRESLLATRALDQRVAAIGHRLAVAAVDLCPEREWRPGFAVHHLSQYGGDFREPAIRAFGLDDRPAVLAVVPEGPAERAGMRQDDVLLSLDGRPPPPLAPARDRSFAAMEALLDAVDAAFADGAAEIEVRRGDARLALRIAAERGCASRFQLVPSRRLAAFADGRYVQVSTALASWAAEDGELAAAMAHELAHNILRHRGGRDSRRVREMEVEADRLSVYLLDRAGYDLAAALRYWRRLSRRGFNFLVAPTHPNWGRRLRLFEAEIEAVGRARAAGRTPTPP